MGWGGGVIAHEEFIKIYACIRTDFNYELKYVKYFTPIHCTLPKKYVYKKIVNGITSDEKNRE